MPEVKNNLRSTILIRHILSVCCLLVAFANLHAQERLFRVINAKNGLADNCAQTSLCLPDGRMVITSIGDISFYDGVSFNTIKPKAANRFKINNYRGNHHLYCDKHERLWLKHRYEVVCVDMKSEKAIVRFDSLFREEGIKGEVEDLFVCSKGELWIVSKGQLANKERPYQIDTDPILNLQDVDQCNGQLLLFYDNGELRSYHLKTGKPLYTTRAYSPDIQDHYTSSSVLYPFRNGFFQIRNGKNHSILLYYDVEMKKWKTIMTQDYSLNNMAIQGNLLYIAANFGYWTYDLGNGNMTHHDKLKMLNGKELATDVNTICFDQQKGIWIGTEKRGLMYSKPITSPFITYTWDKPLAIEYAQIMDRKGIVTRWDLKRGVNCIFTDSRGWKWIGTQSGLQLYTGKDITKEIPTHTYTIKDGMPNDVIHSVVEDNQHNIWACTSYGICCLVIRDRKVKFISCYNDLDNVPAEMFENNRAMKLDDGTIVMIAIDHVLAFDPSRFTMLETTSMTLKPKMTRLMVNGSFISPTTRENGIIIENISSHKNHIELDNNKNSINLTFSSFNYFRPQQTFYRIRVTGENSYWNDWHILSRANSNGMVDKSGVLHLPLLALNPGNYTVEVQASMFPYEWKTPPSVVTITINEPWWQTTGLQLLLLTTILLLTGLNIHAYNRNYRRQAERNAREREIVKKIKNFMDRSRDIKREHINLHHGISSVDNVDNKTLDKQFIQAMIAIMPLLKNDKGLTVRKLANKAGIPLYNFYTLLEENINKNPRQMAYALMLNKAKILLETSPLDITEIADECGFESPNFLISGFFHQFHITPKAYRKELGIEEV